MLRCIILKTKKLSKIFHKLRIISNKAFSSKYLLYTNITLSLVLSSTGDIIEQKYEKLNRYIRSYNVERTTNMAISGVMIGIICHYWYNFLDKRLPGNTIQIVIKKVILDQLICSPAYIAVFFITLGILENKNIEDTMDEIKGKAWKLYLAEWTIWPLAQFINFYWLPTKFRIFYDCMISLGYDIFTSRVKHKNSNFVYEEKIVNS